MSIQTDDQTGPGRPGAFFHGFLLRPRGAARIRIARAHCLHQTDDSPGMARRAEDPRGPIDFLTSHRVSTTGLGQLAGKETRAACGLRRTAWRRCFSIKPYANDFNSVLGSFNASTLTSLP